MLGEPLLKLLGPIADRAARKLDRREVAAACPAQNRLGGNVEELGELTSSE
jgi:hypothetical protein